MITMFCESVARIESVEEKTEETGRDTSWGGQIEGDRGEQQLRKNDKGKNEEKNEGDRGSEVNQRRCTTEKEATIVRVNKCLGRSTSSTFLILFRRSVAMAFNVRRVAMLVQRYSCYKLTRQFIQIDILMNAPACSQRYTAFSFHYYYYHRYCTLVIADPF